MFKNGKSVTKILTYSAICVALTTVLQNIRVFTMPQGGSVTACSMLFIVLAAYWFGPATGFLAGAAAGLLDLLLHGYVVHPAQLLLDYPLAFGALGLAGFFGQGKFRDTHLLSKINLHIGYIVGAAGRLLSSTLSGYIFFASYAPEGTHPVIYSLVYNASYMLPEIALTLIIISIPAFRRVIDTVKL